MAKVNVYAGGALDRAAHRRRDSAWIAARLAENSSRLVPVWRLQNLFRQEPAPSGVTLSPNLAATIAASSGTPIFLGLDGEAAFFALDVSTGDPLEIAARAGGGSFADLRSFGPLLARGDGALLAYARGLVHWHDRHRFCGSCGAPTRPTHAGHLRECTEIACATQHFPRTDPAVIMLIAHEDRCLLGRQPSWPPGLRSTLAGFVEPGESLEEAVAREVLEETGVDIADIRYHSSQPWPFPSSIMLGFTARATTTALSVDGEELESAAWYSRDFLRQSHDPEIFRLPRPDSIARGLIDDWLAEG